MVRHPTHPTDSRCSTGSLLGMYLRRSILARPMGSDFTSVLLVDSYIPRQFPMFRAKNRRTFTLFTRRLPLSGDDHLAEVRLAEVRLVETRPTEATSTEVGPTKICAAQLGPIELRSYQIGLSETRLSEISS